MGNTSTGSAVKSTFGGGQSGQARATGAGNLFTGGSAFSDIQSFAENPSDFLNGLLGNEDGSFERGGGGDGSPLDLQAFQDKLNEINPQFFEADFGAGDIRGIAEQQRDIGRGGPDPRFQRFQESQFNIFESGANQQRANAASQLARSGLLNSSTGFDRLGNIDAQLGQRREALGSRIGLQELGRQDQALQSAVGSFGQAGAAKDLELSSRTAGLENLLAIPTLQVAQTAAQNAGKLPDEKESGLLGNIFEGLF